MTEAPGLRVGVADLLAHPGSRRALQAAVVLPGLGISTAEVPAGAAVEVDLELESILPPGITATGFVRAPWTGACRRCLEPVSDTLEVHVQEVFERRPMEGDTYELAGEQVDLEPMVRDAVLLGLPLAPLCSPECRGPAPDAFPARVEGEVAGDEADGEPGEGGPPPPTRDPRWAGLDGLHFD